MYRRGLVEGLKKLMRRGEITKSYRGEEGFQGGLNFDKPALTPNLGGKPAGLKANTPKAKLKLADSLKRTKGNVAGSNPTIRANPKDKEDITRQVRGFRNDRTAHKAAQGKKKVRGVK